MARRPRISTRLIYGVALFGVGLAAVFAANVRLLQAQVESRGPEPGSALEILGLVSLALVGLTVGGDALRRASQSREAWSQDSAFRALSVLGLIGFIAVSMFSGDPAQIGPVAGLLLLVAVIGAAVEYRSSQRRQRMKRRRWNARGSRRAIVR